MKKSIIGVAICLLSISCKVVDVPETFHFELDGGSYPTKVEVIVTSDIPAASQYVNFYLDSTVTTDDFNGAAGLTFDSETGDRIIIWLEKASFNPEDVGIINHELMHAVTTTMYCAGIPFSDSSEEAYAYQLQYYSNQFYNKIK